ncbi:MAG: polysaccharide deacetylase family protein [Thermovenabulum sp.]|uniref:polysaccharide deacetylase family protein n=1 Tax=Thermovenabulum sp. TaxID=3100335 RepID=UPI003C7974A2
MRKENNNTVVIFLILFFIFLGLLTGFLLAFSGSKAIKQTLSQSSNSNNPPAKINEDVKGESYEECYSGEVNTLIYYRLFPERKHFTIEEEKEKNINKKHSKVKGKTAYLTFDDGPSKNTEKILEILKKENIKATFFVVGYKENENTVIKKIYEEGHSLGNHTFSHRYDVIYSSVDAFMSDIKRQEDLIFNLTGVRPKIIRFPGGSKNSVSLKEGSQGIMDEIKKRLKEEGYHYIDWNVVTGDATMPYPDKKAMLENLKRGLKNKKIAVVLLHDTDSKSLTIEILPEIIEIIRSEGFKFDVIDEKNMEFIENYVRQR